jgi:hypothetical protein
LIELIWYIKYICWLKSIYLVPNKICQFHLLILVLYRWYVTFWWLTVLKRLHGLSFLLFLLFLLLFVFSLAGWYMYEYKLKKNYYDFNRWKCMIRTHFICNGINEQSSNSVGEGMVKFNICVILTPRRINKMYFIK